MGEWLYSILFCKANDGRVFHLQVRGIRGDRAIIVWGTPIDYMLVKHFVDRLNECGLPEEELFEATHDFLVEVGRLGQ